MSTTTAEEDTNAYDLLGLTSEATEAEIRTAYRQRSLKVHPDRNRDNPDATRKFHELNQGYELLLDPLRRLALDAQIRLKEAKKARYKQYDHKRRTMMEDLEMREREVKKARVDKGREEAKKTEENERIMEEGRRMRERMGEEREREMRVREEEERREEDAPPEPGPLDTTVKLKYSLTSHPELTTPESLTQLLLRFGATDTSSIVLSLKASKKQPDKKPRFGTALVPFRQIGDAAGAVGASGREERGLGGVEVRWAGGDEPRILGWLKRMGTLGPAAGPRPKPSFSSFTMPAAAIPGDYESLTLLRLRQAERESLARDILEHEAHE